MHAADTTITIFLLDMRKLHLQFMDGQSVSPMLVDPVSDSSFGFGRFGLTWRTYGQDFPVGAHSLWSYRTEQHPGGPVGRVVGMLVDQFPNADDVELIEAVTDLFDKIEAASHTPHRQYLHSIEYFDMVRSLQFGHSDPYERFALTTVDTPDTTERVLRLL